LIENVIFRPAVPSDAYPIAELAILAGDGIYEFLLEEMVPREMLAGMVARAVKRVNGGLTWGRCFVAEWEKQVIGMVNAYPAVWLKDEQEDLLPKDRVELLSPIDQGQDWESYLLNSIAVRVDHRRKGIAAELVEWSRQEAKAAGCSRLSLNVWADNLPARAFFEKMGFETARVFEIPPDPRLGHHAGSLLMVRSAG
jgi:GNAT superfamily N-acetyltransferase